MSKCVKGEVARFAVTNVGKQEEQFYYDTKDSKAFDNALAISNWFITEPDCDVIKVEKKKKGWLSDKYTVFYKKKNESGKYSYFYYTTNYHDLITKYNPNIFTDDKENKKIPEDATKYVKIKEIKGKQASNKVVHHKHQLHISIGGRKRKSARSTKRRKSRKNKKTNKRRN